MNKKLLVILSTFIGCCFFIIGIITLPHYGINWDTINHLPRGQAYLHFFLTGKKDFSDLPVWKQYFQDPNALQIKTNISKNNIVARSIYQNDGTTFTWFMQHDGNGHPPLSDILSSFFNLILFQRLKLVNDIDSYHVYGIFLAACLIGLIYYWTASLYGKFAGLISSLSLALYPLFWSESHFNTEKDVPETVYWSFFLFCFWKGITQKKVRWLLFSGIFWGLALGTKFNILFSSVVILPWLIVYLFKKVKEHKKINIPKILIGGIGGISIGFSIFVLTWPYLWADPINRISKVFKFYKSIGLTSNIDFRFVGPFHINTYPLYWILYTTPVIVLVLFAVGIMIMIIKLRKEINLSHVFFLLWIIVPIIRVIWPGTTIYGGVRQIMEYIPAMAIIAGIGGKALWKYLSKISGSKISYLVILLMFIPITLKLIEIHPNENVYFNFLIGGLKGAKMNSIPFWGNSFGGSYKEAVSWIDKNAEKGSKVVLAYELLPNIPNIFFRPDIDYHNSGRSGYLRLGEYAITLTYDGTDKRSYYDSYLTKFLNPVYEAKVDGVPVVEVWKNDKTHLKLPWNEEINSLAKLIKTSEGLTIDFGTIQKISRIEINYSEYNCKDMKSGLVKYSKDGSSWITLPGILPDFWRISALGRQPSNGHFIEPFVGEEARFVTISIVPTNSCLKNVSSFKAYHLF